MTMRSAEVEVALNYSGRKSSPTMQRQPAEFKAAREGLLNAFPDVHVEGEDATRQRSRCGALACPRDPPRRRTRDAPDEPQSRLPRMTWLIFKNGMIAEGWDSWNLGRLLEFAAVKAIMHDFSVAPNSLREATEKTDYFSADLVTHITQVVSRGTREG